MRQSLGPSVNQLNTLDASLYQVKEGEEISASQKSAFQKAQKQMRQVATTVQRIVKPSDSQTSDILEDLSIADFSIADVAKACASALQ